MNRSKRVLIVDDEPDIREILTMCLELADGWTVFTAASGAECLDAAVQLHPDLIVLDSMMPGMDGAETLQHLREEPATSDTPVVMLSAKAQADDSVPLRLGASGALQKPFDPATIADELLRFLTNQPRCTNP